jgi:hypothetical protein
MMADVNRTTTPPSKHNGAGRETVVGSYDTYREAADAAALLKNLRIPDQFRSIVPRDIVLAEAGGEMNYGRAVLYGASLGAILGLLLAIFSGSFNWVTPAVAHVWAAAIAVGFGAVLGGVIGALACWAGQDSRDTGKGERFRARRFDVVTDEANADEARRVLREKAGAVA